MHEDPDLVELYIIPCIFSLIQPRTDLSKLQAARHRPIRHQQERTKFTMSVISKPTEECTREGL